MAVGRSSWRASDAVAYEQMRAAADALTSVLLSTEAVPEARSTLLAAQSIDGFDRAAVDYAKARFEQRRAELAEETHG